MQLSITLIIVVVTGLVSWRAFNDPRLLERLASATSGQGPVVH